MPVILQVVRTPETMMVRYVRGYVKYSYSSIIAAACWLLLLAAAAAADTLPCTLHSHDNNSVVHKKLELSTRVGTAVD